MREVNDQNLMTGGQWGHVVTGYRLGGAVRHVFPGRRDV
jgi:hypothetical protein